MAKSKTTWQSIGSAPKDGTRVLIYGEEKGTRCFGVAGWYDRPGFKCWAISFTMYGPTALAMDPTHWMPLPKGPAS